MALYLWPTWLIILVEVVVVTGVSVGGHVLVRRLVPHAMLEKHNDVTGFVLAIVGVIYAVLLAFVVVIAWESFNTSESNAQNEVTAASDLYRLSKTFRDPQRQALRDELKHYAEIVRDKEWPAMQHGGESAEADDSGHRISDLAVLMINSDARNHLAVEESVMGLVRELQDARRTRLNENDEGIPRSLWTGLILGAICTIAFTYLFGVENFRMQLVMTALLATLVALMLSMIVALDYPYRGATSISPAIWKVP
jgi:Protein of unknown function (DUF4239)